MINSDSLCHDFSHPHKKSFAGRNLTILFMLSIVINFGVTDAIAVQIINFIPNPHKSEIFLRRIDAEPIDFIFVCGFGVNLVGILRGVIIINS